MDEKQKDFYLKLRKKITAFLEKNNTPYADILLLAPDLFHLLVKLTIDERVSSKDKAKFIGVIAYFISPIDLLPEFLLGPIGYLDDIALTAYVLNNYINATDAHIVRELWAGDQDILSSIKNVLSVADKAIGSGLWKKIQSKF
ncbi:YkvA family protein [Calditrichota bacterium]